MAIVSVFIYRNYTSDDMTHANAMGGYDKFKTPSEYSWDTPQGKQFVEWNTARDGSGTSHAVGDTVPASGAAHYAIWSDVSIDYLTNSNELKAIANAIRTKGGTSESLTYPSGFVSAIQAISTGTNVSDTTLTAELAASGYSFYNSSGVKTNGTLVPQAARTITPTTYDQSISRGRYLIGTQTIKGDANLVAENIKKDVSIFGVTGSYEGSGGGGGTSKTVNISLTYPYSASSFESFVIYEVTDGVKGQQIGSISSANGSTTVTVSASGNGIICELHSDGWIAFSVEGIMWSCIGGGAGVVRYSDGGVNASCEFVVVGDCSIAINNIEWDD